ncbi:MAG TPA: uracil-DNA glycosylase family protein [Candidatus Dormibacteraeota bacterium]
MELLELHRQILGCRRCQVAGFLSHAAPVLPDAHRARVLLVGQAPGRVEEGVGRPFSGRAGRELFRWLERAGLGDEEQARRAVYLTSITKCFPGPARAGSGDRRPTPSEVDLCRDHLDRQLALIRPRLVLTVGQLAQDRFLGRIPLDLAVGRLFGPGPEEVDPARARPGRRGPLVLPLPHPSGASRWLNQLEHRALLGRALELLRELLRASSGR